MYGIFNSNQNQYGWGNAAADILNAVMQRNAQRGEQKKQANLFGDVADFSNNLNNLDMGGQTTIQDLASRSNPNSNYQGSNVERKTMQGLQQQGLLSNNDFLGQQATTGNIGKGLISGLLQQGVQNQAQVPQSTPQNAPAQQFNFTNPIAESTQYSKENNPAQTTTSAPKSLNEQTALIRSQIAPAMQELIAKGYNPKDVLPLLQQATQDKIAEHTSTYQQQQISDLYQGFISKEAEANPNIKAMYAARLKQAGFDVTTPYKEFAPTYQAEKVNTGGQQLGLSFNPKTGRYEQQFVVNNTVSPDTLLNNDTRIKTTQMNNATSLQAAAMRAARGGGSTRANHYDEGPGTKGGKRLDPLEKQKYNELYQATLEDIWDSATPEIRAQKIQQHAETLNELGYYMDRDVENDLRAITG